MEFEDAMWNDERVVADVPEYVEEWVTYSTVMAIYQGGCASGSYMPAVKYRDALDTMALHGDEVVDALRDSGCFLEEFFLIDDDTSYAGFACRLLSAAVELWVREVVAQYEYDFENAED